MERRGRGDGNDDRARAYLTLGRPTTAIDEERPPFNLAAASLLATGWSSDVKLLSMPCLVVKPTGLLS